MNKVNIMMHGPRNIKLCDAKQVYQYKNTKMKLYKNNAAIWCNKTCKGKQLIPTYANIKINVITEDAKEHKIRPSVVG
jgi:hypothetical protein